MPDISQRLDEWIGLADTLPPAQRRALLRELIAIFLREAANNTPAERGRLRAVMRRLAATLTPEDERELAARIGSEDETPNSPADEHRLVVFLRQGRMDDFLRLFAQLTGLGEKAARRALADGRGKALAEACKAAHFARVTYSAIVLLNAPAKRTPEQTEALLKLYDSAPPAAGKAHGAHRAA